MVQGICWVCYVQDIQNDDNDVFLQEKSQFIYNLAALIPDYYKQNNLKEVYIKHRAIKRN